MRSTGEVMGIDDSFPLAFAKSQMAANSALPQPSDGQVFISVAERDKHEVIPIARGIGRDGLQTVGHARHGEGVASGGHRRRGSEQAATGPAKPDRLHEKQADCVDYQHAQRQRGAHRRGQDPLGGGGQRRDLHHHLVGGARRRRGMSGKPSAAVDRLRPARPLSANSDCGLQGDKVTG